jgi:hypothetical protein
MPLQGTALHWFNFIFSEFSMSQPLVNNQLALELQRIANTFTGSAADKAFLTQAAQLIASKADHAVETVKYEQVAQMMQPAPGVDQGEPYTWFLKDRPKAGTKLFQLATA